MPLPNANIPISLYVHIPWCVRKCPYCDFNSHATPETLPEAAYVTALLNNLDQYVPLIVNRKLVSIFFGGGTPSLFSGKSIEQILNGIRARLGLSADIEITLEANPGTVDYVHFRDYRAAGVNRLSLGVQSWNNAKLNHLGRIHDNAQAVQAIKIAKSVGFDNFNIDIMYGLPEQNLQEAIDDIQRSLDYYPTHFSWYQLTIEPNTVFYRYPPSLPQDESLWEMSQAGKTVLQAAGFKQYEVSAYSQASECKHNRNYWEFGDYLGIGAGAHSKLTLRDGIVRFAQVRQPRDFLEGKQNSAYQPADASFEFMLNALRLTQGVPIALFSERTGSAVSTIAEQLKLAKKKELLIESEDHLCATELGHRFLNDLVSLFLT